MDVSDECRVPASLEADEGDRDDWFACSADGATSTGGCTAIKLRSRIMNEGLLIVRLVFGALMTAHGSQKLFGWFGGYGIAGTGMFFEKLGFRPGSFFAALAGLA